MEDEEGRRVRSQNYTKTEIKTLVDLVEKYKFVVLMKSNTSFVNQIKEAAWTKIATEYNQHGFEIARGPNTLRTKWENLKRDFRRAKNSIIDSKNTDFTSQVATQVISLLSDIDSNYTIDDIPPSVLTELNEMDAPKLSPISEIENINVKDSQESADESLLRSIHFTPKECSLLLECVRDEIQVIFNKKSTRVDKFLAWKRVRNAYNERSPQKRSMKVLQRKFQNMRHTVTKRIGFTKIKNKIEKLYDEDSKKKIKTEPNDKVDQNGINEVELDDNVNDDISGKCSDSSNFCSADPLNTVLNSEPLLGQNKYLDSWNISENYEIEKLKLEILKYQMETAKLERKRVEDAMKADAASQAFKLADQANRTKETALRLRAARLELVAAELKLPQDHPALLYNAEEIPIYQTS